MISRGFRQVPELVFDMKTAEEQVHAQETKWAEVLSRLEQLGVCEETMAMFQDFVNGKMTLRDLEAAIEGYRLRQGESNHT
ncbi:MAG: hypothetical protein JNK87_37870 [Bryobacterales bacterium]|nr:hypothetical protein [Bryobacterales bacterium]